MCHLQMTIYFETKGVEANLENIYKLRNNQKKNQSIKLKKRYNTETYGKRFPTPAIFAFNPVFQRVIDQRKNGVSI